jgi:hypothetical protein
VTTTASIILLVVGAYAALGALVGVAFIVRGVSRVDPAAAGAPIGFKLLILPGAIGLWPIVLKWWLDARRSALLAPAGRSIVSRGEASLRAPPLDHAATATQAPERGGRNSNDHDSSRTQSPGDSPR